MSFQVPLLRAGIPAVGNVRLMPEQLNGVSPKGGYKGPGVHRPLPLANPQTSQLIKEAETQLSQVRSQLETIKNDPFLAKTQPNFETGSPQGQGSKGPLAQTQGSPKVPNIPFAYSGILQNTSVNGEYRPQPAQPQRMTQSFEVGRPAAEVHLNP